LPLLEHLVLQVTLVAALVDSKQLAAAAAAADHLELMGTNLWSLPDCMEADSWSWSRKPVLVHTTQRETTERNIALRRYRHCRPMIYFVRR